VAATVLVSDADQWSPPAMVGLLAVLVLGSDFIVLDAKRFRIGGLVPRHRAGDGHPRPGARRRAGPRRDVRRRLPQPPAPRGTYLLNNLATHATFPLLGGAAAHGGRTAPTRSARRLRALVFAVFIGANVLNFSMIAGHTVWLRGGSLKELFRTVYLPVLPWELATASITAMAVWGFELYGAGVIGLFGVALGVCQLLLRALLQGHAHGEESSAATTSSTSGTRGCSRCCSRR
jgi:hypothetical protein